MRIILFSVFSLCLKYLIKLKPGNQIGGDYLENSLVIKIIKEVTYGRKWEALEGKKREKELGRNNKQRFSRMGERLILWLGKRKWIFKPDKFKRNKIYKNQLYFHTLGMNNLKVKLRQFHLQ